MVRNQGNQRIENLKSRQDAENVAKAQATALEYVMTMILPGRKWRLTRDDALDEADHEIIDGNRREPQAKHRRYDLRRALADTQCNPDNSKAKQRTTGVAHE